ncbi:hypothetical protein [Winogradskyella flava]|uniref:hypothetical protein n=1 Tax=Winogradskyella flava TaxID=1884876 RepID=UPI00248FEBE1|nr:hypothetical protein [Winogradskyella flava]
MTKNVLFSVILIITSAQITSAITKNASLFIQTQKDSSRIAELNRYWERLNKTVIEGDFEGNKDCFHKDAVVVFASGQNKTSVPISVALIGWKQSFKNTKEGKTKVNIELRFSQRIGDETTAHETGIFVYTSTDSLSKVTNKYYIPFEMLLVKRNNKWYAMMEYQKPLVTKKEWDALK